jgi:plasmid stabilization system protein ParE
MNVYEVRVTTQAQEQIRDIAYYIAVTLHAPDAAQAMVDDLDKVFETISQNPERQFLVEEEPWHSEGVRKIKVKNYLVYFWIDVENAAVQVIGVCYAKRDQIKFLNGIDIE